jgi:CHASE2 domain-containing sensor protein
MMAATPGLDLINGVLAFITALILFSAGGFSMFLRMKIPQQRYSLIFPYLTVSMLLLGFMMVAYCIIFIAHDEVVVPVPTLLFFAGTATMMLGVYKVTEELGKEESRKAKLAAKKRAKAVRPTPQGQKAPRTQGIKVKPGR